MKNPQISIFCLIFSCLNLINCSNIRLESELDNCKYTLNDGSQIDLSKLRRSNEDYVFTISKYTYRANFCGNLITLCPGLPTSAAIFIKNDICLSKLVTSWQQTQLTYLDENIKSQGIRLTFPQGDRCYFGVGNYQLSYSLKCDMTKEIEFSTVIKIQNCQYEYQFDSKYACQELFIKNNHFNSTKILFMFILLFSLYCIGFSYMNYRINPEDGLMKAFPHREFWSSFIDNTRQGIKVIVKLIREKVFKGKDVSDGYSNY